MDTDKPSPPTDTPEIPRVPDHELLALVGRGSYGEVWLARSVTGTHRGVKIVSRNAFAHERPYEREFQGIRKFEPISRSHPGLVSILHVGQNSELGYFYYVMEAADDLTVGEQIDPLHYRPRTLSALLVQDRALPFEECLRTGIALSAALGHLHKHGLVHRDIKPSNIIFVNGTPKLADIGLVTDIGEKITFVGTEGYIPPEGPGNPTADLYALGKVLYEISTGQDHFRFPSLPDDFRTLQHGPHRMRLNEIILKACDANPKKRFQTAEELRAVLQSLHRDFSLDRRRADPHSAVAGSASETRQLTILTIPDLELDTRLARLIQDTFSALGYEVFVDEPTRLSLDWARMIEVQVAASDAVLALLSPASARNEHLAYALEIASQTARQKRPGLRLLPVRVRDSDPLPRGIQIALGTSPVFAWDGPEHDQRLIEDLNRALGKMG